jgi:uncharacterized membrane protein YgcG
MWDIGVLNTNDIRELENMDPVEGGEVRYHPLNMGTLGAPPSVDDVLAQQEPGSGIDGQAVEGGVAAAAEGEAAPAEPAQSEQSMTPQEVQSLLTITKQITDGLLTIDAARAIITAAFPVLSAARVETILQGVQTPKVEPAVPAPQPEQASESRAEPRTVAEGDFVSWDSSGGRARGRIDHIMDYGTLGIPDTDFTIDATEEDPAALITVYEEVSGGWRPTETQVGHKVATLTKIDPLPEPPPEENAYGKPKRKPAKRDCGTGAGGFKPGNKCGKGGDGGGADSGGSGSGGDSGGSDGGSADRGEASEAVKSWAEKKFDDPEHAKAFTKWFGDSKVVDDKGEPLVVYHGTGAGFDEFQPSAKGMLGPGIYASADKDDYGPYSPYAGKDNAQVKPLYMTIRNPHYAIAGDTKTFDAPEGTDGTILIDRRTKKILWAVAKTPTSVKSATGNSGTFDPDDPKITRSVPPKRKPGRRKRGG